MKERTNKTDKVEPLDLNGLVSEFQAGQLERVVAKPDLGAAHEPHVDLMVRPTGGEPVKYRIYDPSSARDLPPGGISLP